MEKWHKYQMLDSLVGKVGHAFTYQNGSVKDTMRFIDVRAGLAWATDESPFYCVILGQDWFDPKLYYDTSASFTVIFESTDNGLDLARRYNELADITELYKCDLFADLDTLHEPEADSWYGFRTHKGLHYGDLDAGPWADNFRMGVELIKTAVRTHKLTVPKDTEIFHQLQRITQNDLADRDVKFRYFAIEAARHVVASFKRDPATLPDFDVSKHVGGNGQDWMF